MNLIKDESRVYVKIQIYEMLEPEDCHFYVSENKRTRQNSSQSRAVSLQGRDFLIISPTYQKTQIMIHLKGIPRKKSIISEIQIYEIV